MPLIQSAEDIWNGTPAGGPSEEAAEKPYTPAASVLTVHSGRNRKVLEEQLKQASKGPKKIKEPLKFKHELLLGHVSMLTDIVYATIDSRSYIITADRDEHIRVSRGLPQAHIIEGFCQGHEEFISNLCLTKSGLLVSGGGDANLFIWNWHHYRLLEKVCIRDYVLRYYRAQPQLAALLPEHEGSFKTAVSGIWSVPNSQSKVYAPDLQEGAIGILTIQTAEGCDSRRMRRCSCPLQLSAWRIFDIWRGYTTKRERTGRNVCLAIPRRMHSSGGRGQRA